MRTVYGKLLAIAVGVSTLAIASASAQAAVVCDQDGDCWHAHEAYRYPPAAGIVVHPDDWRWEGERFHWREHEGRGYWHGGGWVGF